MPSHIILAGIDAHLANHDDFGRIWLIYRHGVPHGVVRELGKNSWMQWVDVTAMHAGDDRCYRHEAKLETIMERIAQENSNQPEKSVMNEDQAKANIIATMNDYVDQRATDREGTIRTIDNIGIEFPQLRLIADDAITTVLFRSFDLQQAA